MLWPIGRPKFPAETAKWDPNSILNSLNVGDWKKLEIFQIATFFPDTHICIYCRQNLSSLFHRKHHRTSVVWISQCPLRTNFWLITVLMWNFSLHLWFAVFLMSFGWWWKAFAQMWGKKWCGLRRITKNADVTGVPRKESICSLPASLYRERIQFVFS